MELRSGGTRLAGQGAQEASGWQAVLCLPALERLDRGQVKLLRDEKREGFTSAGRMEAVRVAARVADHNGKVISSPLNNSYIAHTGAANARSAINPAHPGYRLDVQVELQVLNDVAGVTEAKVSLVANLAHGAARAPERGHLHGAPASLRGVARRGDDDAGPAQPGGLALLCLRSKLKERRCASLPSHSRLRGEGRGASRAAAQRSGDQLRFRVGPRATAVATVLWVGARTRNWPRGDLARFQRLVPLLVRGPAEPSENDGRQRALQMRLTVALPDQAGSTGVESSELSFGPRFRREALAAATQEKKQAPAATVRASAGRKPPERQDLHISFSFLPQSARNSRISRSPRTVTQIWRPLSARRARKGRMDVSIAEWVGLGLGAWTFGVRKPCGRSCASVLLCTA